MKFKAKMLETLSMRNLALISNALSKLSKLGLMKLGSRQMSLLVYDEGATPRRLLVSVHINTAQFFNNFSVDGISSSNEIFLEFPTDMLSSSLSSLRQTNTNVKCVEILLTEQNSSPCLTFKMEFVSEFAMTRWCVHDIPVTVVPCNEWSRYHEPVEKTYTVSLEINNLKKLRSVVESLKRISQHVNIIGSTESLLSLHAQSQSATVKVIFKNIYQIQVSDESRRSEGEVRVDVKRLHQVLSCDSLNAPSAVFDIAHNDCLHCRLTLQSFLFHFYLPSIDE